MPERFFISVSARGCVEAFYCCFDESVLAAMMRAGLSAIRVGCRGGGCGLCRVVVAEGDWEMRKFSRAHVTPEQAREGSALACRLYPKSDLRLSVPKE